MLLASGFSQSKADYSLFTKSTATGFTTILVYVDDLILAGTNLCEIQNMTVLLYAKFKIKDLGDLKFFLGMEVARSKKGIALYQRKYTLDLLEDCRMLRCKPSSTPMDYILKLSRPSCADATNSSAHRRLAGRLLYFTNN